MSPADFAGRYDHVSVSALSDAGKRAEVNLSMVSSCIEAMAKHTLPQPDAEIFSFESGCQKKNCIIEVAGLCNQLKTLCGRTIILVETGMSFCRLTHADREILFIDFAEDFGMETENAKVFGILRSYCHSGTSNSFRSKCGRETRHRLSVNGLHYTRNIYEYCFQELENDSKGLYWKLNSNRFRHFVMPARCSYRNLRIY